MIHWKVRNCSNIFIFSSVFLCYHDIINMTWLVYRRKLGGDITETGSWGDQTWSSLLKFVNKTVGNDVYSLFEIDLF